MTTSTTQFYGDKITVSHQTVVVDLGTTQDGVNHWWLVIEVGRGKQSIEQVFIAETMADAMELYLKDIADGSTQWLYDSGLVMATKAFNVLTLKDSGSD